MIWDKIDWEVITEVFISHLPRKELDVIDAIWAAREPTLEDLLLDYQREMFENAREEI